MMPAIIGMMAIDGDSGVCASIVADKLGPNVALRGGRGWPKSFLPLASGNLLPGPAFARGGARSISDEHSRRSLADLRTSFAGPTPFVYQPIDAFSCDARGTVNVHDVELS
jgi:hypothetical protein